MFGLLSWFSLSSHQEISAMLLFVNTETEARIETPSIVLTLYFDLLRNYIFRFQVFSVLHMLQNRQPEAECTFLVFVVQRTYLFAEIGILEMNLDGRSVHDSKIAVGGPQAKYHRALCSPSCL